MRIILYKDEIGTVFYYTGKNPTTIAKLNKRYLYIGTISGFNLMWYDDSIIVTWQGYKQYCTK